MAKFDFDISLLEKTFGQPDKNRIPVKGNENRMIKVAFDMFRLDGDSKEDLWLVQADDDGNEFLVRTYDLPDEGVVHKESSWSVLMDKKGSAFTVAYNDIPISKIAASAYNVYSIEDAQLFKRILFRKLADDKNFADSFVQSLPEEKKNMLQECGFPGFMPEAMGDLPEHMVIVIKDLLPEISSEQEESDKNNEKEDDECETDHPDDGDWDANQWWGDLPEKEQKKLYEKFKDVPSITKEQALRLTRLEFKLGNQK